MVVVETSSFETEISKFFRDRELDEIENLARDQNLKIMVSKNISIAVGDRMFWACKIFILPKFRLNFSQLIKFVQI